MCLILLAINRHPEYPLILAANRDEFFARPTRSADFWEDAPAVLGGRDLEAGGSWLGVDRSGRLAAVTNVREPPQKKMGLVSRGRLVSDYLTSPVEPWLYLQDVIRRQSHFDAYNLLVGWRTEIYFHASGRNAFQKLDDGIYGITNGELDCPWPKVIRGKAVLHDWLESRASMDAEALFEILADTTGADDAALPDTGVGLEVERRLASIFIHMDGYGTRCSTVLAMDSKGEVLFFERNFNDTAEPIETKRFEFTVLAI